MTPDRSEIKRLNKGFWQIADPKIWVGSAVPLFFAAVLAWTVRSGDPAWKFDFLWFFLACIGVFLIEIGKNAVNEVVDFKSGADPGVDDAHFTPFSGGKKTITQGVLNMRENIIIAVATLIPAAIIGLAVVFLKEFQVLYVGIAGFGLSVAYSLPPFKLCYRGLGEASVGITFGPLIVAGTYLTMAGADSAWANWLLIALCSMPFAFLIANVLWINEYPDYETDLAAGKKNLVVRLGKKRAVWGYAALFVFAYLGMIAIAVYERNAIWLIGILSAPLAWKSVLNCAKNYDNIGRLIKSNALTVQIYILTGILMSVAAIVDRFI
jgi:1,4-dihydroxy-2-naphthoate octaprenyltransferase